MQIDLNQFLAKHGLLLVFAAVLVEQMGIPLPAIPWLLVFDGLGALLYGICFVMLGYCFSNQIQQITDALASIGGRALGLLALLLGGYIGMKYWQRRRILRELRMARISVTDLHQKQ